VNRGERCRVNLLVIGIFLLSSICLSSAQDGLFVPAYFDPPSPTWNTILKGAPVQIIIANPNNGPGSKKLNSYVNVISKGQANGISMIGYVASSSGNRPIATVEKEITNWYNWYSPSGIFIDEGASTASKLPYYKQLYNFIKAKDPSAVVMLNPGIPPNQGYVNVTDILLIFESSQKDFNKFTFPSWVKNYSSDRFGMIIHHVSSSSLCNSVLQKAKSENAGYIFVTNSDSYQGIPSYWSTEITNSVFQVITQ